MDKKIWCLDGSGGSTKIVGIAQIWAKEIEKNGMPKYISGVSASAILSLPFACGKISETLELMKTFNEKTIFSRLPLKKGFPTPRAIFNLVVGKNHLGKMGNLEKTLKNLVTETDYNNYRNNKDSPIVVVMATRYIDKKSSKFIHKKKYFVNLKSDAITYDEAIRCIIASSSIALAVPPIEIIKGSNVYFYDGGYTDHSIGAYMLRKFNDITDYVSVFSRPYVKLEDIELDEIKDNAILECSIESEKLKEQPKNGFSAFSWGMESHISEVSLNDEQQQVKVARIKNIKLRQYFLPNILEGLYDTNRDNLNKLIEESKSLEPNVYVNCEKNV